MLVETRFVNWKAERPSTAKSPHDMMKYDEAPRKCLVTPLYLTVNVRASSAYSSQSDCSRKPSRALEEMVERTSIINSSNHQPTASKDLNSKRAAWRTPSLQIEVWRYLVSLLKFPWASDSHIGLLTTLFALGVDFRTSSNASSFYNEETSTSKCKDLKVVK